MHPSFWHKAGATVSFEVEPSGFFVSSCRSCRVHGMSSPILFILLLTQQWKGCSSEKSGSLAMVRVTYRSTIKCLDQDWARVSPKNGITLVCKKCWMHEERYWGWGAGGRILKMVNCFFSTCQVHNNSYSLFFSLNPAESLFFFSVLHHNMQPFSFSCKYACLFSDKNIIWSFIPV